MPTEFILPDILSKWPWPRRINPHYDACRDRAQTWIKDLEVLPPQVQRGLNLCDPSLLAALAYPDMSSEQLRVACELMYTFGVFDDISDKMDAQSVQVWVDIIKEVLAGESLRPTGEPIIGKIIQSFWSNANTVLGTTSRRRFISEFNTYTQSVVEQNQERGQFVLRDVDGFMKNRRYTVGARPAFALLEMDMEMPEDVFNSPPMVKLQALTVDMLCIANDIFSFNVEQANGDNHNLVTLVMENKGMDLQTAIDYVATLHDQLVDKFLAEFDSLPSFGSSEVDAMVHSFVHGLGNWVRANEAWSFEGMRYFGREGPRIQLERRVELLVKVNEAALSMPDSPRIVPT